MKQKLVPDRYQQLDPLILSALSREQSRYYVCKQVLDVVVAAFALIPVSFDCYKFRTLMCNANLALHKAYVHALISDDCQGMAII